VFLTRVRTVVRRAYSGLDEGPYSAEPVPMNEGGNCFSNSTTSVTENLIKIFGPKFELDSNTEDGRIVKFGVLFSSLISTEKEK